MPDWHALAAQQLAGLRLPEARREQVLQELSEHLEDEFAALRQRLPEDEAQRQTLNLLDASDVLIREIRRAEKEDPMSQTTRALALVLSGIVTGAVLYLLSLVVFVFVLGGTALAAAVEAAGRPTFPPLPWILHLAMGIWTMWLYAALRPRYGPGPKTAAIAGFALWVIAALVEVNWVSFHLAPIPLGALAAPLAAGLPTAILAAVAGAWPYDQLSRPVKTPVPST